MSSVILLRQPSLDMIMVLQAGLSMDVVRSQCWL